MTWACFLQCYWGQDAPLYIGLLQPEGKQRFARATLGKLPVAERLP
jgi:hypothetical protein